MTSGREFEKIYYNIASPKIPKQVRIPPNMKYLLIAVKKCGSSNS